MFRKIFFVILAICFTFVFNPSLSAGEYPDRPITIVVPWKAGGLAAWQAQELAMEMGKKLKVKVLVNAIPGGSSAKGALTVLKAPADGYTILQSWIATFAQVPLFQDPGYKPLRDFYPLAQATNQPVIVAAKIDAPWKTLKDFLDDAKANPNKYKWSGAAALGVQGILLGKLFENEGVVARKVVYPGTMAAIPDLLGGRIDVAAGNFGFLIKHPGKFKALGVFMGERYPFFPDIPTINELGYKIKNVVPYSGYAVRRDSPRPILQTLVSTIKAILTSEDFRTRLKDKGVWINYKDPADFEVIIKDAIEVMRGPIEELKKKMGKKK